MVFALMSAPPIPQKEIADAVLAGSLIAAPAWVPPLSSINEALTTLTLLLGVALGIARLWRFIRRCLEQQDS